MIASTAAGAATLIQALILFTREIRSMPYLPNGYPYSLPLTREMSSSRWREMVAASDVRNPVLPSARPRTFRRLGSGGPA
jgi:hypothetical protein